MSVFCLNYQVTLLLMQGFDPMTVQVLLVYYKNSSGSSSGMMPRSARQIVLNVHTNVQQHVGIRAELMVGRPIAVPVASCLAGLTADTTQRVAEGHVRADHAGGGCDHCGPRKRTQQGAETIAQRRRNLDAGGQGRRCPRASAGERHLGSWRGAGLWPGVHERHAVPRLFALFGRK